LPEKTGVASMFKRISIAAAALALSACATSIPYQPDIRGNRASGGYSETRIAPDRFEVVFRGNTLTRRDRVEGYLLYRAAELTVQNGFDSFRIVDRITERDRRTTVDRSPFYDPWYGPGYGFWRPSWRYYGRGYGWRSWSPWGYDPFWADSYDVRTVERFEARAVIDMERGTSQQEGVIDARKVLADLGPSVERPEYRP
jgi:hypothetical protein